MSLNRNFIRVTAAVLALTSGILTARYVAQARETGPTIHVDSAPINRSPQSGNSYSYIIKKVAPSVVNIYSSRIVKQRYHDPLLGDPFFRRFFGEDGTDGDHIVTHRDEWLGCGIIVAEEGYILTANHVVDGADEIQVEIQNDKTRYSAKVIGMDPPTDVAILKIQAGNLPAATLGDSDQLEVGDVALAIGNPFGIGQTVTRGIISALGRSLSDEADQDSGLAMGQYQNFIQTDAAINEGNSGGALVDAEGRLIGINDAIYSPSGASAGIGFAVPINLARNVLEGFLHNGKMARGFLGVEPQDVDSGLARGFGAPSANGALVTDVTPNSPAAKAGIVSGDIIVAVNDKPVSGAESLRLVISELTPGSQASVKIYRNGAPKTIPITLGELALEAGETSAKPDNSAPAPAKADALDGVSVDDLTPHVRRVLGLEHGMAGALITDVDRVSNSYEAGLRPGDIILEINRQPVANAGDAVRLCKAARTDEILVKVWRAVQGGSITHFFSVDNRRTQ